MSNVRTAMQTYIQLPSFNIGNANFGPPPKEAETFSTQLARAQIHARRWASLCALMLLVLFGVVLFVSYQFFPEIVKLGPAGIGSVSGVFGISSSGAVLLMMRWVREASRAEQLLVLLIELEKRDPDALTRIIQELLRKWYRLSPKSPVEK